MTDQGGYAQPLSPGMAVRQKWVIVTGPDSYAQFQVSDGSTFEVFSNARVVFRPTMGNWKDLLNVWLGRVKDFIQHEPGKQNHNDVFSPTAVISVRGTIFDVFVEDDEGTTLVTVDEGVVGVRNLTASGDGVTLTQGQVVRVYRNQPLLPPVADKGNYIKVGLKAVRDAFWQIMIHRPAGGAPGNVPGGAQGDRGKNGGTPGAPGTGPGAPGTGPGAPSNPPAGPGGG